MRKYAALLLVLISPMSQAAEVVFEKGAAPVASAIATHCVDAVGASGSGGGISIAYQEPVCQHLKLAEINLEAYRQQRDWCIGEDLGACDYHLMQGYLVKYNNHLASANRIVNQGSLPAQVGSTTLSALPFIGLLWLLLLL